MLVSLARIALGIDVSARAMMEMLAGITATLVRTTTGGNGRRPNGAAAAGAHCRTAACRKGLLNSVGGCRHFYHV